MKLPFVPNKLQYGAIVGENDDPSLYGKVLEQRRRFVEFMGWSGAHKEGDEQSDCDEYDKKGSLTIMQWSGDQEKKPEVSMRFTYVTDVESILSVKMAETNPVMYDTAMEYVQENLQECIEQRKLYDVTRAVVNEDIFGTKRSFKSMLRLLGYGQGMTAEDVRGGDEQWIMTLTEGLHGALVRAGIEPTVITRGKISEEDKKESVVCVVKPSEIDTNYKKSFGGWFIRRLYENGLNAGQAERARRQGIGGAAVFGYDIQ